MVGLCVCVYAYLLVTFVSPSKTAEFDRDAVLGADSGGPKEPYITGGPDPHEKGTF